MTLRPAQGKPLRVALGEYDIGWQDPGRSLAGAEAVVRAAANAGAQLVVLPEMTLTGFTMEPAAHAEPLDGPRVRALARLAAGAGVELLASIARRDERVGEPRFLNSVVHVGGDGEPRVVYDKQRLFAYGGEHERYTPGESAPAVLEVRGVRVATFVCYDLRFPATNSIGESHTVTVTVSERTDASLPFAPSVGETVTFTLTNSNGATAVLDAAASTCDNLPTDANGQCTIVFSSATAGTVTVHAQSSVGVGGQTTLASSGTGGNNSGDALKTFVAGTLEWNKVDGSAAFLGGAVFTVCRTERWDSDLPNGGGYADTADVCFDVTDNVSGTDNTNASPADREGDAGKFRLGGIPLGKYTVTEKTAPTGYTKDPDTENASLSTTTASATIATAFVNLKPDARITITGAATNGIGESHTFTVTLEKNLGAGGGWVVATGEHVDVTLSNANGASYVLDGATSTCDNAGANTDSNGQCTIVFTSNSAGTVTGSASASLTVGGVPLSVNTGAAGVGTPGSSTNVVKTFVAGSLRWFKKDGLNALLGGAVFTVCRTENWDSDLPNGGGYADIDPDVCVDVTDNSAPDADADAGELQLNGLILGKYTIIEKTAPNGYIKDTKTENASLSTTTPSATITAAFVNISPEAFITIGPALDTNSVTQSHTFTAVMTVDPKGGGAPTIGNITITVTPTPSSLTVGTTSCPAQTGPDGNGKYSRTCTVQITSTAAGTFTANASGSATVAGATLTRDTDASTQTPAGTGGSGPATKVYVAPQLVLVKTPDSLQTSPVNWVVQPGATATFSIKLTNTGLGEALNTKLRDTLPNSGLDWSIASQSKAACQINAITVNAVSRERLDCDIGTLAPSDSFKVSVSAVVPTTYIQDQPVQTNTLPLEIDGNLVKNGTDTQDWASLPNDIFSCGTTKIGCAFDATNSQQDNSLGQGTSEDDAVPTIVAGSIPNQKSDLLRFYAVPQRLGSTNYLYLAWERVQAPNGTTNMDFELNQSKTASANNVTPVRTAGDILIQYDLAKGGTAPSIAIARWVTAASAAADNLGTAAQVCQAKNSFPCWGKTVTSASTDSVFAAINLAGLTETVSGGNLDALTFGEASINLQKAGIFKQGACVSFGSAYLKSRSSDSFNAELKDFVAPVEINVTNCSDKYLKNDAWGWASNFRPTANDTLGTPIRDHGVIKVGAPTASLWRIGSPTGERLAMSTERAGMWVMRGGDDE